VHFQIEGLEPHSLLAGLAPHQEYVQYFDINTPGRYISQQVSSIDVTITRATAIQQITKPQPGDRQQDLSLPLTVYFSASLGSTAPEGQSTSLRSSASDTFTPVSETITFPAGVRSETVSIPVNSGAANPGLVPIDLSVTSSSPRVNSGLDTIYLISGPAALPRTPTKITSARLIFQGKSASAIAITFSGPMSPASVENVRNYDVYTGSDGVSPAGAVAGVLAFLGGEASGRSVTVPLKTAQYDPTTNTVTLIPSKPLRASITYGIASVTPLAERTLTDLQGFAVAGNVPPAGTFAFSLRGHRSDTWPAPLPATIYGAN
jgi:hypothetical protein